MSLGVNKSIMFTVVYLIIKSNILEDFAQAQSSTVAYAVVIDAGSTGSRVIAFRFTTNSGILTLEDELFYEIPKSLCSCAATPNDASNIIQQLIDKAKEYVPMSLWNITPISMKATAGLRSLPRVQQNELLKIVNELFKKDNKFYINNNSVSIMDGIDEGIYSWFTVNFLLDRLKDQFTNTVAVLEYGGGSIQVTYIPIDKVIVSDNTIETLIVNQKVKLFSRSYTDFGLMAARKKIFSFKREIKVDDTSFTVTSPCVRQSNKTLLFKFSTTTYDVTGAKPTIDYDECKHIIENIFEELSSNIPQDLPNIKIVAVSFFYDRAIEAGLIGMDSLNLTAQSINEALNKGINLQNITVQSFYNASVEECNNTTVIDESNAYKCLDLIYTSVLLEKGLGLSKDKELIILKKINRHEISWALGDAYSILSIGL